MRHWARTRRSESTTLERRSSPAPWPVTSSNCLHHGQFNSLEERRIALQSAQRNPRLNRSHHRVEADKVQRLIAIAPRLVWIRMHFDQQAIRASGNADARQRGDQIAMTGGVAGIGDY